MRNPRNPYGGKADYYRVPLPGTDMYALVGGKRYECYVSSYMPEPGSSIGHMSFEEANRRRLAGEYDHLRNHNFDGIGRRR